MFYFLIFLTFYLLVYTFHPTMTYSSVWLRPVKWKINSSKFSILSAVTIRWFKIESVERNTLFFPLAPYFLNLRSPQLCSLFMLSYLLFSSLAVCDPCKHFHFNLGVSESESMFYCVCQNYFTVCHSVHGQKSFSNNGVSSSQNSSRPA